MRKRDERSFKSTFVFLTFRTKQKIHQRKADEERALEEKLAEETQHATTSDELERRQRKVCLEKSFRLNRFSLLLLF